MASQKHPLEDAPEGQRRSKRLKGEAADPHVEPSPAGRRKGSTGAKKRPNAFNLEDVYIVAPEVKARWPSPHCGALSDPQRKALQEEVEKDTASTNVTNWLIRQLSMDPPAFDDDMEFHPFVRWFLPPGINDKNHIAKGLHRVRPIAQEAWVGPFTRISWDHQISAVNPKRRNQTNSVKPRRALDIVRQDEKDGNANYYLRWIKNASVTVNGMLCDGQGHESFAIGPLPDYAIIEIEDAVIFWWRNEVALDYLPEYLAALEQDDASVPEDFWAEFTESSAQTSKDDASQDEQDPNAAEVSGLFFANDEDKYVEWRRIFEERMQFHREQQGQDEAWRSHLAWRNGPMISPDPIHQIVGRARLYGDDVVLSIACLWQALRSGDDDSAFTSYDFFQACHLCPTDAAAFEFHISAAVGRYESKHLIIPIIGGDHILLAVATRPTDSEISKIQYEIFDSSPLCLDPATIERAVRNAVVRSGWLARDTKGYACAPATEPALTRITRDVPAQVSVNSCGIHAILNAWVYLLRLPPLNSTSRYDSEEDLHPLDQREVQFITNAEEMINLALTSHMDTLTIRAFINGYGYCELQDPDNPEPLADISTVLMTSKILEDIVEEHRQDHILAQVLESHAT
ncbi:MAG: hypothetical protein Q9174_004186 [Haloplaca sp. 1 TL-2023]